MFGQTRRRRIVEVPALAALGETLLDSTGNEKILATIAAEQAEFGGLVQARFTVVGGALTVTIRYAAYRVAVGAVPAAQVSAQLLREVSRVSRGGYRVAWPVDIAVTDDGVELWLNRPVKFFAALQSA